jgi:hypothetical protein
MVELETVAIWETILLDLWHAAISCGVGWIIWELTRQRR